MQADSQLRTHIDVLHSLLQKQLQAFIIRLNIINRTNTELKDTSNSEALIHRLFQSEVEKNFNHQLRIADYADRIGCSEKRLYRAVQANNRISPKKYLSHRIALEAKRLLAHTDQRISVISHQLGFDEHTNFSKFFIREVGLTPLQFRAQYHQR